MRSLTQVRRGQEVMTLQETHSYGQSVLMLASWPDSWQGKKWGSSKLQGMLLAGDTRTSQEGFKWKSESKGRNCMCRKCAGQTNVSQNEMPQKGGAQQLQCNQIRWGLVSPQGLRWQSSHSRKEMNQTAEDRARQEAALRGTCMGWTEKLF